MCGWRALEPKSGLPHVPTRPLRQNALYVYGDAAENIRDIIKGTDHIENQLIEVHFQLEMAYIGHIPSDQDRQALSHCSSNDIWNLYELNRNFISIISNSFVKAAGNKLNGLLTDTHTLIDRLMGEKFEFIPAEEGLQKEGLQAIALEWKESEIQRLRNLRNFNQPVITEWDARTVTMILS